MGTEKKKLPHTPDDLTRIAGQLRDIAQKYEIVAKWLADSQLDAVQARNLAQLNTALDDISRHIGAVVTGYGEATLGRGVKQLEKLRAALEAQKLEAPAREKSGQGTRRKSLAQESADARAKDQEKKGK